MAVMIRYNSPGVLFGLAGVTERKNDDGLPLPVKSDFTFTEEIPLIVSDPISVRYVSISRH